MGAFGRLRSHPLGYGRRLRDGIHSIAETIGPYVRVVLPNFRAVHYCYIITMAFLGSVLMYPVHNASYIDILFTAAAASTQAGLNTINMNEMTLYQQIVVYLVTTLTTPIFIHGSLLFVRLYWFERHFDNIRESSKLNFKMRRNATLAARTRSFDSTRMNTQANQGLGFRLAESPASLKDSTNSSDASPNAVIHVSEPSDEETHVPSARSPPLTASNSGVDPLSGDVSPNNAQQAKRTIEPSDMYRSIAMLQNNQSSSQSQVAVPKEDDDDVLIIKSPNEIEQDSDNPIFIKKETQIQFTEPSRHRPPHRRGVRKWSRIRSTLSHPNHRRTLSTTLMDDESIDSEHELEDTDGDGDVTEAIVDSDDEVQRATTAEDKKIGKRTNTLDEKFTRTSTFDGIRKRSKLRRLKTPSFHKVASRLTDLDGTTSFTQQSDEEGYVSGDNSLRRVMSTNYLSWTPTVGRNSTFVHLTEEQKEELGGVEYRAVKLLIKILLVYYVGFHIVAFLCLVGWILNQSHYLSIVKAVGVSPTWWGFFTAQSSFNDLGYTLTPDSMQSFKTSVYVMIIMAFFIVIGNTGFPVFLRFLIWIMFKLSRPLSLFKESLGFLLDHPRRCFTLLFPSVPTWWLFTILVVLNAVDLVLFIVLDLHSTYLSEIPVGYRVMDGLFQAFSTRTAGFAVIDLSQLHPAIQVSYMLMMYISVLPLAISIRRTNVYEEQSLGLYLKEQSEESDDLESSPKTFIGAHLRNQLSFDLWFIFLGLFIICIAEGGHLNNQDFRFTPFTVLFEIISAYGTVGLSLGYPNVDQSFTYKFTTLSKLVIIAMMIRGRHRGLPYSLDRAIMLPDEQMHRRDRVQENHAIRRNTTVERTNTNATTENPTLGAAIRRVLSRRPSTIPSDRRPTIPKPVTPNYVVETNDQVEEAHELDELPTRIQIQEPERRRSRQ